MKPFFRKLKAFFMTPFVKDGHTVKETKFGTDGTQTYSFNPRTGEVRCETGVFYTKATSMRRATRKFKLALEKATGKAVIVDRKKA